jgi:hypothetical protein
LLALARRTHYRKEKLLNHLLVRYSKKARHEGKIESKRFERVEADSRAQDWGNLHLAYLRFWEF